MREETAVEKAVWDARQKLNELNKIWMEKYPDNVDQTYYKLVKSHLDILQTLVRLSGGVSE